MFNDKSFCSINKYTAIDFRINTFLSFSFHGGTDAVPAFQEAVSMLQTDNYKKADVLVVSDFILGNISQEVLTGMH